MANLPSHTKRGRITKVASDDGNYHVVQVDYMGKVCDVEVITPYGLYSNIPSDGIVTLWNVQGQEENRVGIGNTPRTRFKNLRAGEVVVGSPTSLSNVKFFEDGKVVVTGKNSTTVTIDADGNIQIATQGNITMNAEGDMNLTATGDIVMEGATIQLNGNSVPLSGDSTVLTN